MLAGGLVFINGSAGIKTKYQRSQIHYAQLAHRYLTGIIKVQVGQIIGLSEDNKDTFSGSQRTDNVPAGQWSGLLSSEEKERDVSVLDH